jgi:N-carbamoylputrescine amidase
MQEKAVSDITKRTIRVAAVQVISENGKVAENLRHATPFVEEAAALGAKLVLLPEFMPTGYVFTDELWDGGEPQEGPTVKWLKDTSKRLGIWMGTSYLEADGEDFYNTFVLTNPDGEEDGRVRKQTPSVGEAFFTRGGSGPRVINTQLGRIGVGICLENALAYTPRNMYSQFADLMLQPHSSPARTVSKLVSPKAVETIRNTLENRPLLYAGMLGIPVVFCNRSGKFISPMPGVPFLKQDTHFDGLSAIVDSDGTLKARLGREEGVIVADVSLDPGLKKKVPPVTYGRYAMPDAHWTKNAVILIEAIYGLCYRFSSERKRRAREISLQP